MPSSVLQQYIKKPILAGLSAEDIRGLSTANRTGSIISTGVESERLLERMQQLLYEQMAGLTETVTKPDGTKTTVKKVQGLSDFIDKTRDFMDKEGISTPGQYKRENDKITNIGARSRLQLIFDTTTRSLYSQARWEKSMTPEYRQAFPADRFVRYPGAKTKRIEHIATEGEVRLRDDFQFWALQMNARSLGGFEVPWGPYGFNSYMDRQPVSFGEAKDNGLVTDGWMPVPVDTSLFGATIPERAARTQSASTKGMYPETKERLKKMLQRRYGVDAIDENGRLKFDLSEALNRKKAEESRRESKEQLKLPFGETAIQPPPGEIETLLEEAGINADQDATLEQLDTFLQSIRQDHSNINYSEILTTSSFPEKRGFLTSQKAQETAEEFLSFIHEDILRSLPSVNLRYSTLSAGELGTFTFGENIVEINSSPTQFGHSLDKVKETIYHELTHWLHVNSSPMKREMIASYFKQRIGADQIGYLNWNKQRGYSDDFAPSFRPTDDYAGRFYGFEDPDLIGIELPTRHMQKLSLPAIDLLDYFNDKSVKTNTYLWREAFLLSLKLFIP